MKTIHVSMFFFFCFDHKCVFLLSFRVQAQAVTLTVAQAFKVALDLWEIAQEGESVVYVAYYSKKIYNLHAIARPLQSPLCCICLPVRT